MSPEAAEHPDQVTAATDIYAIGAVGYFLLTGTPVFSGKTILEICMKQVRQPPDSLAKRLGKPVSASVEAAILHCLAKAPTDRPTAMALLDELSRCEPNQPWSRGGRSVVDPLPANGKRVCPGSSDHSNLTLIAAMLTSLRQAGSS